MKHAISVVVLLATFVSGLAVGAWKPGIVRALKLRLGLHDSISDNQGPYYRSRLAFFRQTAASADVVMLGDSITEGVDWHELFPDVRILNRGIAGDTSEGVLHRLDEVIGRRPKLVFLMIGMNDLQGGVPVPVIDANIRSIVGVLEQKQIRIVLQKTLYATSSHWPKVNSKVNALNGSLSDLCSAPRISCVDLNRTLAEDGVLLPAYSLDGLHLNTAGYLVWKQEIAALFPP